MVIKLKKLSFIKRQRRQQKKTRIINCVSVYVGFLYGYIVLDILLAFKINKFYFANCGVCYYAEYNKKQINI